MKLREISLAVILIFLFSISAFSERVVSLAPAITEILFKIGQGSSIVGNTKFCNYPEQANYIKNIGGYLDINIEMIIDLNPDVIFHYPEHSLRLNKLKKYTRLVQLPHKDIDDLIKSIVIISNELRSESSGEGLIRHIRGKLDSIKNINKNLNRKKVLIVIGRDSRQLKNITIIGKGDFLNEILEISGGKNAYTGRIPYPSVSIESIIKMDPEIIIEFSFLKKAPAKDFVISLWEKFPLIRAVREGNIRIISDDFWVRPGPRVVNIAESMYKMLNSN